MGAAAIAPPPGFVEDIAPPPGFVDEDPPVPDGFVEDSAAVEPELVQPTQHPDRDEEIKSGGGILDSDIQQFIDGIPKIPPGAISSSESSSEDVSKWLVPANVNALSPSVVQAESDAALTHEYIKEVAPIYKATLAVPLVEIPKPENTGVGSGITRGLASTAESLVTLENMGIMTAVAKAPKLLQQLTSAGFGAHMIAGAVEQFEEAGKGATPGERAEGYTKAVTSLLLGGLAAKHATGRAPIGAAERLASMDDARLAVEQAKQYSQPVAGEAVAGKTAPAGATETAAIEATATPAGRTEALPSKAETTTSALPEATKAGDATSRNAGPPEPQPPKSTTTPSGPAPLERPEYAGGPGAMGPVEAAERSAADRVTGTKNEQMRLEREARGEEALVREQSITNRESIDQARATLAEDPNRGAAIVERLKTSTQDVRTISTADEAVLMAHKVELMKQRAEQESIYGDGNRTPEEHAVAAQRLTEIESKMNDVDQATYASGAEWGRMGQLRQRLLREDYSFEAMERRARIQKGDALTPEESVKIKEQAAKISELEKQLEAATKQGAEKAGETAAETAFKETKARAESENRKSGKKNLDTERESLVSAIGKRAKEGDTPNDIRSFVQRLALNLVRSGVTERGPLSDRVHSVLHEIFPDITKPQSRDLISGYGDMKLLDKEAAKVTLRGLKGEMQQIGKIEDMQAKQAPKKTGMERRTLTDEERRLIKEVNELKKKGGFVVTDPATQLKTAQGAIKTRLQNEIRDLDQAIATKEPLTKKTGGVEYDAEMTSLKEQRDAKRTQYDDLFPKKPLTDAETLAQMGKALDQSIAELESSLKDGRLYPDKTSRRLTSPEIEAKNARLEALRHEREQLRDLDTVRVEADKEAKLLGAIEKAQKATAEPKDGAPTADTQRVSELKRTLQEVRDAKASSPETMNRKIEQATEAVRKQISELDRRIREGDVSTREGKEPLRSNELDALRSEREALESYLREERHRMKPRKSADEIALQAYKTRTANRIAELNEKIAAGDFTKAPKRELTLDKPALDLKVKIEQVKEQYNEGVLKLKMANRTLSEKIFGGIAEVLNTTRAILTSIDVSAVGRQGGFTGLGNPLRAARAIPDMFRAFVSETAQKRAAEQIKARPNFNLYEKAGLYIADIGAKSLSKLEENYMSRFGRKLPLVAGSERAYITFLNRLRADTFDALVNSLGGPRGTSLAEAKVLANFVNASTGRGALPGKLDAAAAGLSTVFFSPRYVASRFQLMMGEPMYRGTARTRIAIAKEYAKFLGGAAIVYAMAKLAGADVEEDSRSSDFGKLKFGNTRIDPLGGILQNTVLISKVATGEKKDARGNIIPLRGENVPFKGDDIADVLFRFSRTKFSPLIGAGFDLASGENVIGQPVTKGQIAANMVIPMSLRDVYDTMQAQGIPKGTAITILNMFGWGAQTYDENTKKK